MMIFSAVTTAYQAGRVFARNLSRSGATTRNVVAVLLPPTLLRYVRTSWNALKWSSSCAYATSLTQAAVRKVVDEE